MDIDVAALFRRGVQEFGRRVPRIGAGQWEQPSVNPGWSVRDLVNHVVVEDLWMPPLFAGATIEQVGDRFDGDVLGADPGAVWTQAADAAVAQVEEDGALQRIVHLSFGDLPGSEYALQVFADHLIHAWDLARSIGADDALDGELVEACTTWFAGNEEGYRAAGAIAARPEISADAGAQARLLAMFGRLA